MYGYRYVTKHYVYVHMVAVMLPVLFSLVYGLFEPNFRYSFSFFNNPRNFYLNMKSGRLLNVANFVFVR